MGIHQSSRLNPETGCTKKWKTNPKLQPDRYDLLPNYSLMDSIYRAVAHVKALFYGKTASVIIHRSMEADDDFCSCSSISTMDRLCSVNFKTDIDTSDCIVLKSLSTLPGDSGSIINYNDDVCHVNALFHGKTSEIWNWMEVEDDDDCCCFDDDFCCCSSISIIDHLCSVNYKTDIDMSDCIVLNRLSAHPVDSGAMIYMYCNDDLIGETDHLCSLNRKTNNFVWTNGFNVEIKDFLYPSTKNISNPETDVATCYFGKSFPDPETNNANYHSPINNHTFKHSAARHHMHNKFENKMYQNSVRILFVSQLCYALIVLMLLIIGNVELNPGPPTGVKSQRETREVHNSQSYLPDTYPSDDKTKYSFHMMRLSTYTNWLLPKPSATSLANAGFVNTGTGDMVKCYWCNISVNNWQDKATPNEEHSRISPNCDFVQGKSGTDIRTPVTSSIEREFREKLLKERNVPSGWTRAKLRRDEPLSPSNNTMSRRQESVATNGEYAHSSNGDIHADAENRPSINRDSPLPSTLADRSETQAAANEPDNSRAVVPHSSPHEVPAAPQRTSSNSMLQSVVMRGTAHDLTLGDLITDPRYPQYATYQSRLDTYVGWPGDRTQTAEDMADAGFYYASMRDCVKCYFCNGGLHNWLPGDSAWMEHARWFPRCEYVRRTQGVEFVSSVQHGHSPVPRVVHVTNPETRAITSGAPIETGTAAATPRPFNMGALMMTQIATNAIEMGFRRRKVEAAIRHRMQQAGTMFANAADLLDVLLTMADVPEEEPEPEPEPRCQAVEEDEAPEEPMVESDNGEQSVDDDEDDDDDDDDSSNDEEGDYDDVNHETVNKQVERMDITEPNADAVASNTSSGNSGGRRRRQRNRTQKKQLSPEAIQERMQKLQEEKDRIKAQNELMEQSMICKTCTTRKVCILVLPCAHLVLCEECVPRTTRCSLCNRTIQGTVKTYLD